MSNLSRLAGAGIINANATFNANDQAIIDSLSDDEVAALISISQKVPASFLQQHVTPATSPANGTSTRTIGIVF
jgi:hypothetical protein